MRFALQFVALVVMSLVAACGKSMPIYGTWIVPASGDVVASEMTVSEKEVARLVKKTVRGSHKECRVTAPARVTESELEILESRPNKECPILADKVSYVINGDTLELTNAKGEVAKLKRK